MHTSTDITKTHSPIVKVLPDDKKILACTCGWTRSNTSGTPIIHVSEVTSHNFLWLWFVSHATSLIELNIEYKKLST